MDIENGRPCEVCGSRMQTIWADNQHARLVCYECKYACWTEVDSDRFNDANWYGAPDCVAYKATVG